MDNIVPEIIDDIGSLLKHLSTIGVKFKNSEYSAESFGNYYIDTIIGNISLRIIKDRGQYMLDGDVELLKDNNLLKAYDSKADSELALNEFVKYHIQ